MYVNDVRILKTVRNTVKLFYGHTFKHCPYPVVYGQYRIQGLAPAALLLMITPAIMLITVGSILDTKPLA